MLYVISIAAMVLYTQLMAFITQGFLCKLRTTMFDNMQDLPIKYFDTHRHGDIMSYYTNDIDALRQLVSQALPAFLRSGAIVLVVLGIMIYYCGWLTLLVLLGVVVMFLISKKIGGGSSKYFVRQQIAVGKVEGFAQEMMSGQKVVKVFNHEEKAKEDFDKLNEALFEDGYRANAYANSLGPIIMNVGNLLYVLTALIGGALLVYNVPNFSISGLPITSV